MGSMKTKLIYNLWTTSEWIRQSVRAIAVPIPESGHWSKAAWGSICDYRGADPTVIKIVEPLGTLVVQRLHSKREAKRLGSRAS
jgi:hypothetical protein